MATKTITTPSRPTSQTAQTNQPLYRKWGSKLIDKQAVGFTIPNFTEPTATCRVLRGE